MALPTDLESRTAEPAAAPVPGEAASTTAAPFENCVRLQPVSGRYEGAVVRPGPLPAIRQFLDLRIDIDSRSSTAPAMNRVSADLYRALPAIWPGRPGRVYQESWIIDRPSVTWRRCEVEITGTVRWWRGLHPVTRARIVVPWTMLSMGPAIVTLTEAGGSTWTCTCAKRGSTFRDLELEIDVCASVNAPPLVPVYDTHAHPVRPAGTPQRTLTIGGAYREAGVAVTVLPHHTVIDDSAPGFVAWSPAELHDAMEQHYSRFGDTWPDWRMWGLLAGRFDNAGVGGIMFDAAAAFGGAGAPPERQGFAVFRDHSWFADLSAGAPTTEDEAWALRHYLYTYVHEAGHAFNFLHSWDKSRPDALSWMNYDWRYDQRNGAGSFWAEFPFRFDDEELIHLRHGDRAAVIMGGDPWASGGHLEGEPAGAMAQLEGDAPIELLVRSKRWFEFMEPVSVELRLRNLTATPLDVDARMQPEAGTVTIYVQRPDGSLSSYEPVICQLGAGEPRTLAATGVTDGSDRVSESIFIAYGRRGFLFDAPGQYRVRAVYQGVEDLTIPSNTATFRVGAPTSPELDRLAADFFTHEVGLALYLDGSQSPYLAGGMDMLEDIAHRRPESMLGTRAAETVARSVARPFFRIEGVEGPELVQTHAPEPDRALEVTEAALAMYQATDDPALSIAYHGLARTRAEALGAKGDVAAARKELRRLGKDLKSRGVNEVVLEEIAEAGAAIGSDG